MILRLSKSEGKMLKIKVSLLLFCLVFCFLCFTSTSPSLAQDEDDQWSAPLLIGQYEIYPSNPTPVIIADREGWLHVFWVNRLDNQSGASVIMYTCWDKKSWSTPVDILMSPEVGSNATRLRKDYGFLKLREYLREIAAVNVDEAFRCYQEKNYSPVVRLILGGGIYNPSLLFNREVWAIWIKSIIKRGREKY